MKNALMINFEKNQIVMTRLFAKKCTDTSSEEYAHLQSVRRDYPTFTVVTRQIKKNDGKKVYNYYLLAFDDYSHEMRTYRVDRMKNVEPLGEPR